MRALLDFIGLFIKGNPLVGQDHIKVKVISKSSNMLVRFLSVVLSKYKLNPSINEKVMTKLN